MDSLEAAIKYAEEECERTRKEVEARKYLLICGEEIQLQAQDHLDRLVNMQVDTIEVANRPQQRMAFTDAEIAAGIIERQEQLRQAKDEVAHAWALYHSNVISLPLVRAAEHVAKGARDELTQYVNQHIFHTCGESFTPLD